MGALMSAWAFRVNPDERLDQAMSRPTTLKWRVKSSTPGLGPVMCVTEVSPTPTAQFVGYSAGTAARSWVKS